MKTNLPTTKLKTAVSLGQFLEYGSKQLAQSGILTARLDCLVLLEDVLGQNRSNLLAHPEIIITKEQLAILNKFIAQRCIHEPLAYIRGNASFYGRIFLVNEHVMVPRPETETMIDLLKKLTLVDPSHILDIGTGSGCIGITAKLELSNCSVTMHDIDDSAIKLAAKNARDLKASVSISKQDLLTGCSKHYDVILANLPYVPDKYTVNTAVTFEPKLAIFGGSDGLDIYRRLWAQIASLNDKPRHVFTESMNHQHELMLKMARESAYRLTKTEDLIQQFTI